MILSKENFKFLVDKCIADKKTKQYINIGTERYRVDIHQARRSDDTLDPNFFCVWIAIECTNNERVELSDGAMKYSLKICEKLALYENNIV